MLTKKREKELLDPMPEGMDQTCPNYCDEDMTDGQLLEAEFKLAPKEGHSQFG